jgi:hypothetical protein
VGTSGHRSPARWAARAGCFFLSPSQGAAEPATPATLCCGPPRTEDWPTRAARAPPPAHRKRRPADKGAASQASRTPSFAAGRDPAGGGDFARADLPCREREASGPNEAKRPATIAPTAAARTENKTPLRTRGGRRREGAGARRGELRGDRRMTASAASEPKRQAAQGVMGGREPRRAGTGERRDARAAARRAAFVFSRG